MAGCTNMYCVDVSYHVIIVAFDSNGPCYKCYVRGFPWKLCVRGCHVIRHRSYRVARNVVSMGLIVRHRASVLLRHHGVSIMYAI